MYHKLKRLADIVLALALCLILSPVFVLVTLLIFIESGRPIIFRQTRVGLSGKLFKIYKFRTLYRGAHEVTNPQAMITPIGGFLRRWGIDELPQLINVLKDDMSIVGPRPTIPEQVEHYSEFEKQRLEMRPGITGWAQIHGRNAIDWPARIELDIEYVKSANLTFDTQILLRTPISLISGKDNAYGPTGHNVDFFGPEESPVEEAF
ncbi:MAG: sugar transferase [Rhodothermales bacterium]